MARRARASRVRRLGRSRVRCRIRRRRTPPETHAGQPRHRPARYPPDLYQKGNPVDDKSVIPDSCEHRASRDYAAEMRAVIDAEATGAYAPPAIARRIVEKLRATDPELLAGWLDAQAENIVREAVNHRDRSHRTKARYSAPRSTFAMEARAVEQTNAGFAADGWAADSPRERRAAQMGRWLSSRFTVADGSRKQLADMTGGELLFAGDAYSARARESLLTAAFLKAIARKVGERTVIEHYTEQQLADMWDSLTVKQDPLVAV
jgi:hypothetical protein